MKYDEEPLLLYKVARALLRSLATKKTTNPFVTKIKALQQKTSEQYRSENFNPRQQIKLYYLSLVRNVPLDEVDKTIWTTFEPRYLTNLIEDNGQCSQYERSKNHLLAAKFASFLYWHTNRDEKWLNILSDIDKSGQEKLSTTWIPIDLYLCRFYMELDVKAGTQKCSIPEIKNWQVTKSQRDCATMAAPFYFERAAARYPSYKALPKSYELFFKAYEYSVPPTFESALAKANNNDPISQNTVGWYYERGMGVTHSIPKALDWYEKAAQNGNKFGMCNFAFCHYFLRSRRTIEDQQIALNWFSSVDQETFLQWRTARGIPDFTPHAIFE